VKVIKGKELKERHIAASIDVGLHRRS